jgi:NusB family
VRRVFEEDACADRAFRALAEDLEPRDRAFAMQVAYGTVQRVRTLDHGIEALGRRPVRKLDPPVRAALRIGAYQAGYMEVPLYAAVNESVELALGAEIDDLGAAYPEFRHPRRPEFLLTLPHVHGTSGFFIARMRT